MDCVQGQSRAVALLQAQLASGRVHHAYIFHGPPGVGKFTTALALARIRLCHGPQPDLAGQVQACGGCASCRLLSRTTDAPADAAGGTAHPDLHVVTKELARYSDEATIRNRKLTQIPVEVVREALIEPAHRAANLGHGKAFIVDEAELLNLHGQNALLKTLEEPPGETTIVLVTASEDRLLPTIRSRCQRVPFVPLPTTVVERWLSEHASDVSEEARAGLVAFADGSLGRASLALAHDLADWPRHVLPALDKVANGQPQGDLGAELAGRIDAFAKSWVNRHANASKEAANKQAAGMMASLICAHLRRQMHERADACPAGALAAGEAALTPYLAAIDAVHEATAMLDANVNLSLVCDHLAVSLTRHFGCEGAKR